MSRVGKTPIDIPDGVKVNIDKNNLVKVKGPKGELSEQINPLIKVAVEGNQVVVTRTAEHNQARSMHGLYRNLIANMIQGVSTGYEKKLEVIGVGYRVEQRGNAVMFSLGYSHQIFFIPPEGVEIIAEPISKKVYADGTPNQYLIATITVKGIDKQKVGQVAAKIRQLRPPDIYKSKGIRYAEERLHLKAGKAGV
ncbi:50S ribosomal protein L6 [bacterium]|nr:MAG: 50S ribosomal protein L6 [bacterium]